MKNIHSCTLIIAFFIIASSGIVSCNSDNGFDKSTVNSPVSNRLGTTLPNNELNPYDAVGALYEELFDTYYSSGVSGSSISQIANEVQLIANDNERFNLMKDSSYQNVSNARVQYLVEHPSTCINDVISVSSMSANGKLSLTDFVSSFVFFFSRESDCDVIYDYVVAYENVVLDDPLLTETDKRIIFTTTSIARFSSYRISKRPKKNTDPDWTVLIGNIIASTEGAENGSAEASIMALVTGIAQNQ